MPQPVAQSVIPPVVGDVKRIMTYPAGTVVRLQAWYIEELEKIGGPNIWLPSPGSVGVVLFQSGTGMAIGLVDAGPGFTVYATEDEIIGCIVAPIEAVTSDAEPVDAHFSYGKVTTPLTVRTEVEGGASSRAVTLRLMGVKNADVVKALGVSRQYIHACVQRFEKRAKKYGYKLPEGKHGWKKRNVE